MISRSKALGLLYEWVKSGSLRRHCLGVAVCMEAYAKKYGLGEEEIDSYWITGLLHDFDYERYPSLEHHPYKGVEHLRSIGVAEEILEAIMGHGNHTGVARESQMAKTLFAVDELSGLCVAYARVRPGNFEGMKAKSLNKAVKKKDFAAAISRDDIKQGIEGLGVDQSDHFGLVIEALSGISEDLGF